MKLKHLYSEHLLRQASQRPLRAWEAAWLKRHLAGCARCSATAAELAHFIRASVRLAPSTADRVAQRLHAALADEAMPAPRRSWTAAWAAAGAAAGMALALLLMPSLFRPTASPSSSLANLSLAQGPAQGLSDPLQPLAPQPGAVSASAAASEPAPKGLTLSAPAITSIPAIPSPGPAERPMATATATATPTPFKAAAARSLTRSASARPGSGLVTLTPVSTLPGLIATPLNSSLPQSTSLPSLPVSSSISAPLSPAPTATR